MCSCITLFSNLAVDETIPSLWEKVSTEAASLCDAACHANLTVGAHDDGGSGEGGSGEGGSGEGSSSTRLPGGRMNCTGACSALALALDALLESPEELPTSRVVAQLPSAKSVLTTSNRGSAAVPNMATCLVWQPPQHIPLLRRCRP